MPLVEAWLRAFAATLILEIPVVVWLTRDIGMSVGRRIGIGVLANLATHPAVWFIIPQFGLGDGGTLAVGESWAVVIETGAYFLTFNVSVLRALGISALANGCSYAIGLVLYHYTSIL